MKIFFTLLLVTLLLISQDDFSQTHYPKLYSQLGTPLFEQADNFETLTHTALLHNKPMLRAYLHKVKTVLEHGLRIDAEHSLDREKTKAYLKELRELQKLHDQIEMSYKKQLYKSIHDDDQNTFYTLIATPLPFISTDMRLKEEVVQYYKKTRENHTSSSGGKYNFSYLSELSRDFRLDQQSYQYMNTAFQASQKDQEVEERNALSPFTPDARSKRPVQVISVKTEQGFDLYLENNAYFDVTIELKATKLINLSSSEPLPFIGSFPAKSRTKIVNFTIQDPRLKSEFQTFFNATIGRMNPQYDTDYLYALPYARGKAYILTQGFNGKHTHKQKSAYALDFKMNEGTRVHAMREGVVVALEEKQTEHGYSPVFADKSNHIIIQHDDGTMAMYGHLKPNGVKVKLGQKVYKYAFIGLSGNTGYSSGPHLHVHISAVKDLKTGPVSVPFRFLAQRGKIDSPQEATQYIAK